MKTLSIDIETYSDVPLQKTGVYRYVESPNFEILLFAYSVDGQPVEVTDLACGEQIPKEILMALEDESVIKWAFNAAFERICLSRFLGYPTGEYLEPESWRCSMIWAATMGLPLSLEGVGAVLGLEKQKLSEGKDLIKYFCLPCAPTKTNGQRTRNRPFHAPDKWALFKKYNIRDVETEMGIQQRLAKFPVPLRRSGMNITSTRKSMTEASVWIWSLLLLPSIMDTRSRTELTESMKQITELENPNSVQQMKQWLYSNGLETDSLDKKAVSELLKTAPPQLAQVLTIRQQLAKSSVRKYQAMEKTVCADGRARGMFQFYGANRTGRFSGRNIQLQNLPQNHLPDLAEARALVRSGNFDAVELLYEDVPDTLSQLIRTAFIPREGTQFLVADFSAIEARVIAWFASEKWRQDVFAKGGDIYCASASQMFKVPVEKHGINGHLRQKRKNCRAGSWLWRLRWCSKSNGSSGYGTHRRRTTTTCRCMATFQSEHRQILVGCGPCSHGSSKVQAHHVRIWTDFFFQKRHAFYHSPIRKKAVLCETEAWSKQIWRPMYHLRRSRRNQKSRDVSIPMVQNLSRTLYKLQLTISSVMLCRRSAVAPSSCTFMMKLSSRQILACR